MSTSIRGTFLFLILAGLSALPLSGNPLTYSTGGSTTTAGSLSSGYYWDNCALSSSVCSAGSTGSNFVDVPFTILLNLPSSPNSILTDASLALTLPQNFGSAAITGESSNNVSYQSYNCSNANNDGCYGYNYYNYAPNLSFSSTDRAVLTGIASPSASWSGNTTADSLDLTSLGFGVDLLNGGSLTLTGFVQFLIGFPTTVNASGTYTTGYFDGGTYYLRFCNFFGCYDNAYNFGGYFNASSYGAGYNSDTSFNLSYGDTNRESAVLSLDATDSAVPEPTSMILLGTGLLGTVRLLRKKTPGGHE